MAILGECFHRHAVHRLVRPGVIDRGERIAARDSARFKVPGGIDLDGIDLAKVQVIEQRCVSIGREQIDLRRLERRHGPRLGESLQSDQMIVVG